MPNIQIPNEKLVDLLTGIAELGNPNTHAIYKATGQPKYRPIDTKVTKEIIRHHLSNEQPIGCYFVLGKETHVGVIDCDDHDGNMAWGDMVEAAERIVKRLGYYSVKSAYFRSGGGSGLHIWVFWETPQEASLVTQFLKAVVEECGYKHGTAGGIQSGVVEIFPKNREVKQGSLGNLIALPLSRESVALDESLRPIEWGEYEPPALKDLYSPPIGEIFTPQKASNSATEHNNQKENYSPLASDLLPGDDDEARAALLYVPSDDYETWIRMGFALKNAFGSKGFEIWKEWSKKSSRYPGDREIWEIWDGLEPDGTFTIGSLFWTAQQNGWNGPSHPEIREMNRKYAILTRGKATMIIEKDRDPDDVEVVRLIGKQVLHDRLASRRFQTHTANGESVSVAIVPHWMKHPRAEHVQRLEFEPDRKPGVRDKTFNCWTGFSTTPVKGEWSLLKEHVYEVIANGKSEPGDWIMNWMAICIQKPGLVVGTAPVLLGSVGVGKGILANAFGHLWGRHFLTVTHPKHVQGNFSGHFFGRRFVFVDEGMYSGDRSVSGIIKTRVTEPYIMIEQKGVDAELVPNHLAFMVASNNDSVVAADRGDRRWQVFEASDKRQEDRPYFAAITRQLRQGGYGAMLYDLLHRDISVGPNPRKTTKNEAVFEQAIRAAEPQIKYIYDILDEGSLPQATAPGNGPNKTTIRALFEDMAHRHPRVKFDSQSVFGTELSKIFPTVKKVQSGTFMERVPGGFEKRRSMRYSFPDLATCRRQFAAFMKLPATWTIENMEWQEPERSCPGEDYPF